MIRFRRIAAVALLSLGGACTLSIQASDPKPNIDLPKSRQSLILKLDRNIPQDFNVPSRNGIAGAEIHGWRTSLRNGFKNGFGEAFAEAESGADLTLSVLEAEPSFVPGAVAVNHYGAQMGAAAATAQVRYKIRLVDRSGKVLRRSSGTVRAKVPMINAWEATQMLQNAVESMYEKVASDLFGTTPGAGEE